MRLIILALAVALSAAVALSPHPAPAQKMLDAKKKDSQPSGPPRKSSEDKDYKAAVDRLPDQKFDPWRNMR